MSILEWLKCIKGGGKWRKYKSDAYEKLRLNIINKIVDAIVK